MTRAISIYRKFVIASLRAKMQYKFDFIVSTCLNALLMSVDFALVAAILLRFEHVAGWDIYEVGVLYGMSSIAMSLYRTFAPEIHDFESYVVEGQFDGLLVRPLPTLFLLLSRNVEPSRLGEAIQGGIILTISCMALSQTGVVNAGDVMLFILFACFGSVIPFSLGLMSATVAFWTVRIGDLQTFTMYAPVTASLYPLGIYPKWLRAMLLSILPVGFINYIPVSFLLGKGGAWWWLLVTPIVMIIFACAAYAFWQHGERHYHGTGS